MNRVVVGFALALIVASTTGCTEDVVSPTGAPSTPQGVTAEKTGSGWVVSWEPNSESDLAGYELYRAPAYVVSEAGYGFVQSTPATVTSSPILVEGGEWIYTVRARDLEGNLSAPSTGVLIEIATAGGGSTPAPEEGVRRATR